MPHPAQPVGSVTARKVRGRRSEKVVAERLRVLYPYAHAVNSSAPGPDILETPGMAVEVKARRGLDLVGWLRQARRNAGRHLPVLVVRGDGQGEATVDDWAVVLRLADFIDLAGHAGHGEQQR